MNSVSLAKKAIAKTFDPRIFRTLLPFFTALTLFSLISSRTTWSYMKQLGADPLGATADGTYYLFTLLGLIAGLFFVILVFSALRHCEANTEFITPNLNLIIRKSWKIFLSSIISYFFIVLGTMCFIIPGIFLIKRYIFVLNVAEEEMLGPLKSMRRSRELSKENGWATLLSLVLVAIPFYAIYFVFMFNSFPVYNPSASYLSFFLGNTITGYIGSLAFFSTLSFGYNVAKNSINRG